MHRPPGRRAVIVSRQCPQLGAEWSRNHDVTGELKTFEHVTVIIDYDCSKNQIPSDWSPMIATLQPRSDTAPHSPRTVLRTVLRTVEDLSPARCVVVGAGSAGRRHLRNLAALGIDSIALRSLKGGPSDSAGFRSVHSWDEASDFEPSIAIIANPTALHVDAALEATRLGCHVLIEKPVADCIESTMQLQAAITRRNTTALVGYQFRFHPTLRAVRDWLQQGVIGEPVSAHAHWGEYLPGSQPGDDQRADPNGRCDLGGGLVLALSHPLDYMRWLLGEVTSVSAMTARRPRLAIGVEDVAIMALRMKSGALASISLDYVEQPARHTLDIVGTAGTISWDAATGTAHARCNAGATNLWVRPERNFNQNTLLVSELQHFLACVRGTEQPNCTLADGVWSVTIAEAVLRSAREGRVVRV